MFQNLYMCMYTHEHMLNLSKPSMNVGGLAPAFCNFHFCHKMFLSFFLRLYFFKFLLPLFFSEAQAFMPRLPDFRICFKFQTFARTQVPPCVSLDSKPQPYNQFFGWFEMPCLFLSSLFGFCQGPGSGDRCPETCENMLCWMGKKVCARISFALKQNRAGF